MTRHNRGSFPALDRAAVQLCVGLLLSACGDGVSVIGPHAVCTVGVNEVAVLGRAADPASISSGGGIQVTPLGGGRWVVLDRGNDIYVYGSTGEFEGFLAKRGSGPEELRIPASVVVAQADSLLVADFQSRWVIVAPDGRPIRTVATTGVRQVDGFTTSGQPFKLHAAGVQTADGRVEASLFVRVLSAEDGSVVQELGPGVAELARGARVGAATYSSLLTAESDTAFLVAGNWGNDGRPAAALPGEPGVMRWTLGSSTPFVGSAELVSSAKAAGIALDPYIVLRGIAGDQAGYWLIGAVRSVAEREFARLQGVSSTAWHRDPVFKEAAYHGVAWRLDRRGRVAGVARFGEFPDGMAGQSHFFSVRENDVGLRSVHVFSLTSCAPESAGPL